MYYELMSTVKQNIHKKRSRQSNQALRDLQSIQSMSCSAVHEFANALIETSKVLERGGYHRFAIVMMNFNAVSGFAEPDSMKQLLSMLDVSDVILIYVILHYLNNGICCRNLTYRSRVAFLFFSYPLQYRILITT